VSCFKQHHAIDHGSTEPNDHCPDNVRRVSGHSEQWLCSLRTVLIASSSEFQRVRPLLNVATWDVETRGRGG